MAIIQYDTAVNPAVATAAEMVAGAQELLASAVVHGIILHMAHIAARGLSGVGATYPAARTALDAVLVPIQAHIPAAYWLRGFRTFAEQDGIYAQGRETAGAVVTNAKGGQSYHCYGLALDLDDRSAARLKDNPIVHARVREECAKQGVIWGADFGDWGHFEWHPGFEWGDVIHYF